jgi:hypothetical protein
LVILPWALTALLRIPAGGVSVLSQGALRRGLVSKGGRSVGRFPVLLLPSILVRGLRSLSLATSMPIAGSPSGRDWGGVGLVSGHNLCVAKSALKVELGVYAFKRVTFYLLLICRGKPGLYKSDL